MNKKNVDVIAEVMAAMYAQDKLEEIQNIVDKTTGNTVSKAALIKVLQQGEAQSAYECEEN